MLEWLNRVVCKTIDIVLVGSNPTLTSILPWCNGSITVSKTADRGSNPLGSATFMRNKVLYAKQTNMYEYLFTWNK